MDKIAIRDSGHPLYADFKKIYSSSFPIFEQRTESQQAAAFDHANYRLDGYADAGTFIGFISHWDFDGCIYVEHFAVNAGLRGAGYGSRLLGEFAETASKTVILEIDPPADEISEARLRFYKKCGFCENPYPHSHPPYRLGFPPHPLAVMSFRRMLAKKEYRAFAASLEKYMPLPC